VATYRPIMLQRGVSRVSRVIGLGMD